MDVLAWSPPAEFEEYRIVRLLGHGAMGQVYLAHDALLDRPVAVKFVHTEDPAVRARFFQGARAIARLQHPNVISIYRVAEVAQHPYLVSEYVQGRTLDQLDLPVPWRQVLDLALDLARGLAAVHRCGVLHRDVKPANTMLTEDGQGKLLDFGLARVMDDGPDEDLAIAPAQGSAGDRARSSSLAAVDATMSAGETGDGAASAPEPGGMSGASSLARGSSMDLATRTSRQGTLRPGASGTPLYMAPEVWRGDRSSCRSDLYSLGIMLYEMLAGKAPHRGVPMARLGGVVQSQDIPPLGEVAPAVDPALAAIVDRLVERDASARFASADELLRALEALATAPPKDELPDGNPYRGLAAFDSAHGPLFFGRRREIRELVDRVRTEAFVVVGGDSGAGKSSLCRAGALPWLAEHEGWSCVDVIPGRHPVRSLAAALAAWTDTGEAELAQRLVATPEAVACAVRQHIADGGSRRRLLLFVDQLEELMTLSEPEEARAVAAALAALAVRTPSVRVLACCRSDFLSRVARLPGLADEMVRGLYFLPPLTGERVREAIVRPAAAKGVVYESEALIDTLVAQAENAPGGLPLLQFTLAELWDARDALTRTIRAESLATLGGVEGALTRHADRLLAGLEPDERDAARRILLGLVTAEGTRARRTAAELLTGGARRDPERTASASSSGAGARMAKERVALEVLVRGRIVVANDVANDVASDVASDAQEGAYEIAHEALLASWPTLQDWLRRDAAEHAARARVEQAAAAWERTGRMRELLWGQRQLAEVEDLDREAMAPREAVFLAAARTAILRRRILGVGGILAIAVGVVAAGLAVRARTGRALDRVVVNQLREATAAHDDARRTSVQRDAIRDRALGLFDAHRWAEGEDVWSQADALAVQEERAYRIASGHLESALLLEPDRAGLRDRFVDLTFERLLRAERDRHGDLVEELAERLNTYGSGRHQTELDAEARIELEIVPAGTLVWSERPGGPRRFVGQSPLPALMLPPGSVVLSFEAPGHVTARLPILLSRGRAETVRIALPPTASAPPGMIYVPPGRFLFGSGDRSNLRREFLNAAPLHEVQTGGFFIGRHEVTFGEWIEFLDDLAPGERRRRTPSSASAQSSLTLTELGPKRWRLDLRPKARTYTAETGQRLHYEHRAVRADQDWTKFPVAAVSYEDALAFAAWLDRTRRIPGARLCDEYEWERAARGADGRTFPAGEALASDDANLDVTYGRDPLAFGPDEVGSHPASRSPVGADDMAGNVWEWTRSAQNPGEPVVRGGGWYTPALSARSMNREYGEPTERFPLIGVRLCATPQ